jgi:hypothetical protein
VLKKIIIFKLSNGICKCIENASYVSKLAKYVSLINIIKKVKIKINKCWLKFSNWIKMVIEVVQNERLCKLVKVI